MSAIPIYEDGDFDNVAVASVAVASAATPSHEYATATIVSQPTIVQRVQDIDKRISRKSSRHLYESAPTYTIEDVSSDEEDDRKLPAKPTAPIVLEGTIGIREEDLNQHNSMQAPITSPLMAYSQPVASAGASASIATTATASFAEGSETSSVAASSNMELGDVQTGSLVDSENRFKPPNSARRLVQRLRESTRNLGGNPGASRRLPPRPRLAQARSTSLLNMKKKPNAVSRKVEKKKMQKDPSQNLIFDAEYTVIGNEKELAERQEEREKKRKLIEGEDSDDDSSDDNGVLHYSTFWMSCCRYLRGTGCVGIFIVGIMITIVVVPLVKIKRHKEKMKEEAIRNMPPTMAPTNTGRMEVYQILSEVISDHSLLSLTQSIPDNAHADSMGNENPYRQAFHWFMEEDPMQLSSNDPSHTIIERYVMALIYFTNGGERWYSKENWLSGKHICDWQYVVCSTGNDTASMEARQNESGASSLRGKNEKTVIELNFYKVGLINELPDEFGLLSNLQTLALSNNKIIGSVPLSIFQLTSLQTLLLDRNHFDSEIPEDIQNLRKLEVLSLSENRFKGPIPSRSIGFMSQLQELYMHTNEFTGQIPLHLSKLVNLELLDMAKNSFTGSLPRDLSNLSKLQFLELSFNKLRGTIPKEFGSMGSLKRLRLNYNELSGTLPTSLGKLGEMLYLNMENNIKLGGSIPSSIGNLRKLKALDLGSCSLTGEIPESIGNLTDLEYLNLYSNHLEGTIPTSLGALNNIKEMRLQFNEFSGSIPDQICILRENDEVSGKRRHNFDLLEVDCSHEIECPENCCTRCSD